MSLYSLPAWHDGAEVSTSGWRSGGPRFKSRPKLISQSWSSYQLNQLGSKAASDSTLKQSTLAGYQILVLYFSFFYQRLTQFQCEMFDDNCLLDFRVYLEVEGATKKLYITSIIKSDAGRYTCIGNLSGILQERSIRLVLFREFR